MRHFQYIILLLVALIQGCERPSIDDGNGGGAMAKLTVEVVGGGSNTRATLPEDYIFERLRIFAINDKGEVEANEYIDDVQSSANGAFHEFEVTQSTEKLLYVIVNEPTSLTEMLDRIHNRSELVMMGYTIAEAMNNDKFIAGESIYETNKRLPMSAMKQINASQNANVAIRVDRVVARVDLYVEKDEVANTQVVKFDSATSINVDGLYYNAYMFRPTQLPTPKSFENSGKVTYGKEVTLKLKNALHSNAERLLSFYMAERTYNIDPTNPSSNRVAINIDKITVDGVVKEINSTILLGDKITPYMTEINRNYVYQIFATYKGKKESLTSDAEFAIQDWTVDVVDGDIEGVMLAVENQVVMDWVALGNSFTAKNVPFGSNREIKFYAPTAYDATSGKFSYELCTFVAQKGASYDLKELSQYGVADEDNFLRKIDWLTNARVVFDSPMTGHFEFTYTLGQAADNLDRVRLQLKSANIRKELEVIYDNGYVPGDLLQANDVADCWDHSVSGLIFAKRGEALHPETTKEVFGSNSAGLFEGDVRRAATDLDQYCKDKLGEKWYAPNKDQLADMQRHVLELGRSYRFNNAPNSLYWSCEGESGNYWTIDFTKGLSEPPAVAKAEAEQHYVRCISNL